MTQNTKHILLAIGVLITIGLIIGGLSGCRPSLNKCNRLYPPKVKDSISYIEKVRVDTVEKRIPGKTTTLVVAAPCPDMKATVTSGKNIINVQIKDSVLTADCISKDDTIQFLTMQLNKERASRQTIEVPVTVYKAPLWSWWSLMVNILFIALIGMYLKFKK